MKTRNREPLPQFELDGISVFAYVPTYKFEGAFSIKGVTQSDFGCVTLFDIGSLSLSSLDKDMEKIRAIIDRYGRDTLLEKSWKEPLFMTTALMRV